MKKTKIHLVVCLIFLNVMANGQSLTEEIIADKYKTYRNHNTIDFDPLLTHLAGKRIAAFGESTHGAYDFYYLNSLLAKELVEAQVVNSIVLEKSFIHLLEVNDYVTGKVEVVDFKVFMNKHGLAPPVRDLILWLKEYNLQFKQEEDKVMLLGMDLQADLKYATSLVKDKIRQMGMSFPSNFDSLGKSHQDPLLIEFISYSDSLLNRYNGPEVHSGQMVRTILNNMKRCVAFESAGPFSFTKVRDNAMADNLIELEEKIIPKGR